MRNNHPHHKSCKVSLSVQEAALGGKSVPEGLRTGRPHRESLRAHWAWVTRAADTGTFPCTLTVGEGWAHEISTLSTQGQERRRRRKARHTSGEGHRARAFQTSQKLCSHFFFVQQDMETTEVKTLWNYRILTHIASLNLGERNFI